MNRAERFVEAVWPICIAHQLLRGKDFGFAHCGFTVGGHIDGSPAFWETIGADVPGGYRPRGVCGHVTAGG